MKAYYAVLKDKLGVEVRDDAFDRYITVLKSKGEQPGDLDQTLETALDAEYILSWIHSSSQKDLALLSCAMVTDGVLLDEFADFVECAKVASEWLDSMRTQAADSWAKAQERKA